MRTKRSEPLCVANDVGGTRDRVAYGPIFAHWTAYHAARYVPSSDGGSMTRSRLGDAWDAAR